MLIIKHFHPPIFDRIVKYAGLKRNSTMDAYKGNEKERNEPQEIINEQPEFNRNLEFQGTHTYDFENKLGHMIEIMLSRKAYMAVKDMNTNPELYHIIEQADYTENDQRHHLKIPDGMIAVSRHMLS